MDTYANAMKNLLFAAAALLPLADNENLSDEWGREFEALEDALNTAHTFLKDASDRDLTNRELVSLFSGVPEDHLASNNDSPDDGFFWDGPREWEVLSYGEMRKVVEI